MALAKFFDKSALAASHILQGYDRESFEARLLGTRVEIAFDQSATNSPEGIATLDLLIRLLARLYPLLLLTATEEAAAPCLIRLKTLATSINPDIEIVSNLEDTLPTISVVVGSFHVQRQNPIFYIGSIGWTVGFSLDVPVGSGSTANPFGAGAAACFGAANVFRLVFADQLPSGSGPDSAFRLSLFDFEHLPTDDSRYAISSQIELPETVLVGLGAVGQGCIWALSRLPSLRGELHLVDDETVDLSNLQRYVLTSLQDIGAEKTKLAKASLKQKGLNVEPHPMKWQDFLNSRGIWHLPMVLVAVDNAPDRIAIQGSLPEKIINAWTQTADLGVSRHMNFQHDACLVCLYHPQGEKPSESQVVADALGLSPYESDVRSLLYNNSPLDIIWLERVAQAKGLDIGDLLPFVGKAIRSFYSQDVCGGLLLGAVQDRQTETPMAFQSALAGILLASELVIEAGQLRSKPIPALTRVNLLRPITPILEESLFKSESCVCSDHHFLTQYARKLRWSGDIGQWAKVSSIHDAAYFLRRPGAGSPSKI